MHIFVLLQESKKGMVINQLIHTKLYQQHENLKLYEFFRCKTHIFLVLKKHLEVMLHKVTTFSPTLCEKSMPYCNMARTTIFSIIFVVVSCSKFWNDIQKLITMLQLNSCNTLLHDTNFLCNNVALKIVPCNITLKFVDFKVFQLTC